MIDINRHNDEIAFNLLAWQSKPLLRRIYQDFYQRISVQINKNVEGKIVEIGSGAGNLKTVIPDAITTDLFPNPWIEQTESAYNLSFKDKSVSNLILFDVFHHLEFPGTALKEFHRVLTPGGRVVILEPCISLLGLLVYGCFHHEPLGLRRKICWEMPDDKHPDETGYYASQSNASRIFSTKKYAGNLTSWRLISITKRSELSYVASGGYSHKQLYPDKAYRFIKAMEKLFDLIPAIFATRVLVVLEKD
jgi:SAM-dependent methyltransferase